MLPEEGLFQKYVSSPKKKEQESIFNKESEYNLLNMNRSDAVSVRE